MTASESALKDVTPRMERMPVGKLIREVGGGVRELAKNEAFLARLPEVIPVATEEEADLAYRTGSVRISYEHTLNELLESQGEVSVERLRTLADLSKQLAEGERVISQGSWSQKFEYLPEYGPMNKELRKKDIETPEVFDDGHKVTQLERGIARELAVYSIRQGLDNLGRTGWEGTTLNWVLNSSSPMGEGTVPDSAIAPFQRFVNEHKDLAESTVPLPPPGGETRQRVAQEVNRAREIIAFVTNKASGGAAAK